MQNFSKYLEIVRKNVTRGLAASLLMTHIAEKEALKVKLNNFVLSMCDFGTMTAIDVNQQKGALGPIASLQQKRH